MCLKLSDLTPDEARFSGLHLNWSGGISICDEADWSNKLRFLDSTCFGVLGLSSTRLKSSEVFCQNWSKIHLEKFSALINFSFLLTNCCWTGNI